jgi:archaeal flagellar protein FlaI
MELLEKYDHVEIKRSEKESTPLYSVIEPKLTAAESKAVGDWKKLATPQMISALRSEPDVSSRWEAFRDKILAKLPKSDNAYFAAKKITGMALGYGVIGLLIDDDNLEEIMINGIGVPVFVYHRKWGMCRTNIAFSSPDAIDDLIGELCYVNKKEKKEIIDIAAIDGNRINVTADPLPSKGSTITIRKQRRSIFSVVELIEQGTLSPELAAFLWLAVEGMKLTPANLIIAGSIGSGKTTLLNSLMPFMPPNHRVITIEDTRELSLPSFLHWVPMNTRPPNPRGEGGVDMLDLVENSLRMRPDRIVVGEVRRKREAEVLFEAMHTGHSVYGTFHAERAYQVVKRLTNPPMDIPKTVLESLHLIAVQYRNRRTGKRRTFEIAEVMVTDAEEPEINVLFQWDAKTDSVKQVNKSLRVMEEISMHTGLSEPEIKKNLKDKETILAWMLEHQIKDVESVGKVVSEYYRDEKRVLDIAKSKGDYSEI